MIIDTKKIFNEFPEFRLIMKRHDDFSAFYQVVLENTYKELFKNIKQCDTIIDAGANIGAFTVPAAKLIGPRGTIISIEPEKTNFSILKENVELNNLNNVILINKALYNESDINLNISGNGVFAKIDKREKDNFIKSITLNDIVLEYNIRPKIMKMDIEGSELYAMESTENALKSIKYMEMEIHNQEADKRVNEILMDFNKAYKNAENNDYIKIIKRHPFYFLNLEVHNRFKTALRIIRTKNDINNTGDYYPKIGYFYKNQ